MNKEDKINWVPVPKEENSKWVPARQSQVKYYKNVALYYRSNNDKLIVFKPAGKTLEDMRINLSNLPKELYIKSDDKLQAIKELHRNFNIQLEKEISSGDLVRIRDILVNIVEETLAEPRSGSLQEIPETINILVNEYAKQPHVLKNIATLSFKDYTTAIHSINVMALTLGFCFYTNFSIQETEIFGLSGLLHDLGKIEIPTDILTTPRKLTDEEFELIKAHPSIGYQILKESELDNEDICLGALEHHEKLDGSGYPREVADISRVGQLIGIVDCYEALTNDDRPYRSSMTPFQALKLIKNDVRNGKYNKEIYEKFVYSLS